MQNEALSLGQIVATAKGESSNQYYIVIYDPADGQHIVRHRMDGYDASQGRAVHWAKLKIAELGYGKAVIFYKSALVAWV